VSEATEASAAVEEAPTGRFGGLRFEQLRNGTWFRALLEHHAKARRSKVTDWATVYPGADLEERADRHVARVGRRLAFAGAAASAGASAGELLTLLTDGMAAPVGVPAAMVSMMAEGAYTTLAHLGYPYPQQNREGRWRQFP